MTSPVQVTRCSVRLEFDNGSTHNIEVGEFEHVSLDQHMGYIRHKTRFEPSGQRQFQLQLWSGAADYDAVRTDVVHAADYPDPQMTLIEPVSSSAPVELSCTCYYMLGSTEKIVGTCRIHGQSGPFPHVAEDQHSNAAVLAEHGVEHVRPLTTCPTPHSPEHLCYSCAPDSKLNAD